MAPWADLLYACDGTWWDKYQPVFEGEKWTQDKAAANKYGLNYIAGLGHAGMSLDPGYIHYGKNSGYQLLNLMIHFGISRAVLLGYDYKSGPKGMHWFGNHQGLNNPDEPMLAQWRTKIAQAVPDLKAAGVEVINCSRDTAIDCFPRERLEDVL